MPVRNSNNIYAKLDYILSLTNLSPEHQEIFKENFLPKETPIEAAARRLLSSQQDNLAKFNTCLSSISVENPKYHSICAALTSNNNGRTRPLIILHPKDPSLLRVFPNLTLSQFSNISFDDLIFNNSVLKDFKAAYNAEKSDENRKHRWEPFARGWRQLKTYEDMPIARALTRYGNFSKELLENSALIRDFATAIEEMNAPLELTEANTPEEFVTMYATGPSSCMTHSIAGREGWKYLTDKKHCPTSFYAYYPHTKGVYAVKNDRVVARVIVFKQPPYKVDQNKSENGHWFYGRVYAVNQEYFSKFTNTLTHAGYKPLAYIVQPPKDLEFTIPGLQHGSNSKVYYCPYPYMDNINFNEMTVSYNIQNNEFKFAHMSLKYKNYIKIQNRGGFLQSTDYAVCTCSNCGHSVAAANILCSEDGVVTCCSQSCLNKLNYHAVLDGSGRILFRKLDGFEVATPANDRAGKVIFTNYTAASRNNFMCHTADLVMPEEGNYIESLSSNFWKVGTPGLDMPVIACLTENRSYLRKIDIPINIKRQQVVTYDSTESIFQLAA